MSWASRTIWKTKRKASVAEAKRWWWDDDLAARQAYMEESVDALMGDGRNLTRTHALVCADWALREADARARAEAHLAAAVQAIARAAQIASPGHAPTGAPSAQETA